MLKLIIEDDEGRKTVVPFVRDEITVGRQEGNTIRLTERNVSRRHARLLRQNGHVVVEDLGSYNGIRVNGEKIAGPAKVHSGDLIQIGDYDLAIQDEAQAQISTPPSQAAHPTPVPMSAAVHAAAGSAAVSFAADEGFEDTARSRKPVVNALDDADAEPLGNELNESEEHLAPAPNGHHRHEPSDRTSGSRQSTAVIRMDQLEGTPNLPVEEIDSSDAPRLVVTNTELAGREFACIRSELRLGRTEENDIQIDHRSMSRSHAKLVRDANGDWKVVDLQSANGIKINGEPYAQSSLAPGDVLELGHVRLKFLAPGQRYVPERAAGKRGLGGYLAAAGGAVVLLAATAAYVLTRPEAPTVADVDAVSQPIPDQPAQPPPPPDQATATATPGPGTEAATETPPDGTTVPAAARAAEEEAARVAEALQTARQQMSARNFDGALETLDSLQREDGTYPDEAADLVDEAQAEANARRSIEQAEQELEAGRTDEALALLGQAEATNAFKREYDRLKNRADAFAARELARKPRPAPPPSTRPQTNTADAQRYLEEGTVLLKKRQFAQARDSLNRCLRADRQMARCHMYLGSAYAKLREIEAAARHYRLFVEMAPEDPLAPRVREFLDQHERQKRQR